MQPKVVRYSGRCPRCGSITDALGFESKEVACKWGGCNGTVIANMIEGQYCCSGNHFWLEQHDAQKCCNPEFKRVLVRNGGECQQICAGVVIGRAWEKV